MEGAHLPNAQRSKRHARIPRQNHDVEITAHAREWRAVRPPKLPAVRIVTLAYFGPIGFVVHVCETRGVGTEVLRRVLIAKRLAVVEQNASAVLTENRQCYCLSGIST